MEFTGYVTLLIEIIFGKETKKKMRYLSQFGGKLSTFFLALKII